METQRFDPDLYIATGMVAGAGLALVAGLGGLGITVGAALGLAAGTFTRYMSGKGVTP